MASRLLQRRRFYRVSVEGYVRAELTHSVRHYTMGMYSQDQKPATLASLKSEKPSVLIEVLTYLMYSTVLTHTCHGSARVMDFGGAYSQ